MCSWTTPSLNLDIRVVECDNCDPDIDIVSSSLVHRYPRRSSASVLLSIIASYQSSPNTTYERRVQHQCYLHVGVVRRDGDGVMKCGAGKERGEKGWRRVEKLGPPEHAEAHGHIHMDARMWDIQE